MKEKDLATRSKIRAIQYWYVDGTYEFSMGGLCLLLAIYFFGAAKLEDTLAGGLLTASMVIFLVLGGFLINWLVMRLKENVTFPRTGYISFKRTRGKKRIGRLLIVGLIAGLTSALLALWLVSISAETLISITHTAPRPINWMPGITGLMFGIAMAIVGFRSALPRFYLAATFSLGIGAALMFSGLSMNLGLTAYYGLVGVALLAMGGVTFWQYLKTTTPPSEADDEQPA